MLRCPSTSTLQAEQSGTMPALPPSREPEKSTLPVNRTVSPPATTSPVAMTPVVGEVMSST